jgi:hypothetical protein
LLFYTGVPDITLGNSSSFDNLCSGIFLQEIVPVGTFPVVSDVIDLLPQKNAVVLSQQLSLSLPNILTGM